MKAFIITILSLMLLSTTSFIVYKLITKENSEKPITLNTENIEDTLTHLGYTKEDILFIQSNFTKEEIETYLLSKKYNSLKNYKQSKVFNIENLERYDNYKKNNSSYTDEEIVMYVEIGLDKEFYTNIKEITNYDDILCLVNKYYKLPANFEAKDIITLDNNYASNSQKLKEIAATNVKAMIDSAKNQGYNLKVISGYRTESVQNSLFNNSVKKNGAQHALLYSAKPGHSEHQTGLAVDLNSVEETFAQTKEYTWLQENAHKYGFIERYPKDKEFITGYGYEPWHYRYVGIKAATIIKNEQITFEEYSTLY